MSKKNMGYRKTFMDRVGPDGIHAPGMWWRLFLIALVPVVPLYIVMRAFTGASFARYLIIFVILALFFSALSVLLTARASNLFGRILWPRGQASPYQHDFSFEKALVMQNRVAEALESFEERIRAHPEDTQTILEAAELNASKGSRARAIELFRCVRQVPAASQSHCLNATNRLIDVYMRGSEANEENVQKELRYLIATFPQTQAAAHARDALARQK